jgi:hypothetical protein
MGLIRETTRIVIMWIAIYMMLLTATFLGVNPLSELLFAPIGMFMVFCGLICETLFIRL